MSVIATRAEASQPTSAPAPIAVTMIPQLPITSVHSVAITAIAMPTAAIMLPRLAVLGWVPWRMPRMKRTNAAM